MTYREAEYQAKRTAVALHRSVYLVPLKRGRGWSCWSWATRRPRVVGVVEIKPERAS